MRDVSASRVVGKAKTERMVAGCVLYCGCSN
jgi:hypothetical protein